MWLWKRKAQDPDETSAIKALAQRRALPAGQHRTESFGSESSLEDLSPKHRSLAGIDDNELAQGEIVKPDVALLDSLDPRFFEQQFDAIANILSEDMPEDNAELEVVLLEKMSYFDRLIDANRTALSHAVQKDYNAFIQGARQVHDVDMDLTRAGIHMKNARRKLRSAQVGLVAGDLNVVRLHRQRSRAHNVIERLHKISSAASMREVMEDAAAAGNIAQAVEVCLDALSVLENDWACQYSVLRGMRAFMSASLPRLRLRADGMIVDLCCDVCQAGRQVVDERDDDGASGSFDSDSYGNIVQAYLILDEELGGESGCHFPVLVGDAAVAPFKGPQPSSGGVEGLAERIQRQLLHQLDKEVRSPLLAKLVAVGNGGVQESPYAKLSTKALCELALPVGKPGFVRCVMRAFEGMCNVLHTHFLFTQWHREPFSPENCNTAFLHRPVEDSEEESDELRASSSLQTVDTAVGPGLDEAVDDEEAGDAEDYSNIVARLAQRRDRRKQRERTRLGVVLRGLRLSRKVVWSAVQDHASLLLKSPCAGFGEEGLKLHQFRQQVQYPAQRQHCTNISMPTLNANQHRLVSCTELLMEVGRSFSGAGSLVLGSTLRQSAKRYFGAFHDEAFEVLRSWSFLTRENWCRIGVSVESLGGVKTLVTREGDQQKTMSHHRSPTDGPDVGLFDRTNVGVGVFSMQDFATAGNPFTSILQRSHDAARTPRRKSFLAAEKAKAQLVKAGAHQRRQALSGSTTEGGSAAADLTLESDGEDTADEDDGEDEEDEEDGPPSTESFSSQSVSSGPDQNVITTTIVNCLARYTGRYLQFMREVPLISAEACEGLRQLFDFYLDAVVTLFVPADELNEVFAQNGSAVDGDFRLLRDYITRGRAELSRSPNLRVAQLVGTPMAPATAEGTSNVALSPTQTDMPKQQQQKVATNSSTTVPVEVLPGMATAGSTAVPTRLIRLNSAVESSVTSTDEAFGLASRCVAAESLSFALQLLSAVEDPIRELLPAVQRSALMKRMYTDLHDAVVDAQTLIYRSLARQLARSLPVRMVLQDGGQGMSTPPSVMEMVAQVRWDVNQHQMSEGNKYIASLLLRMRKLWSQLQRTSGEGSVYPLSVPAKVWEPAVASIMDELLEAFSAVKRCSAEGRALMSLDLAALARGLDDINRSAKTAVYKARVDNYVKAFYLQREADVLEWISQNREQYELRHLQNLVANGIGARLKQKRLRELFDEVAQRVIQ